MSCYYVYLKLLMCLFVLGILQPDIPIIDYHRLNKYASMFFCYFTKGNNFWDFLHVFLGWWSSSSSLTTYVIRMLCIPKVTPFRMVKCSKSYCKSCSFQSLQKASAVLHLSLWKSPIFGVPKIWFHWAYHNNSWAYHNNSCSKTTCQATHLKDMQYFICVLAGISLFSASGSWVNTISQKFPMKSENLCDH